MSGSTTNQGAGFLLSIDEGPHTPLKEIYRGPDKTFIQRGLKINTTYNLCIQSIAMDGALGRPNKCVVETTDTPDGYVFKLDEGHKHGAIVLLNEGTSLTGRGSN